MYGLLLLKIEKISFKLSLSFTLWPVFLYFTVNLKNIQTLIIAPRKNPVTNSSTNETLEKTVNQRFSKDWPNEYCTPHLMSNIIVSVQIE